MFTRMFLEALVAAADRAKPAIPALAAPMASWLAYPTRSAADEINTIEPPPVFIMARAAARRT